MNFPSDFTWKKSNPCSWFFIKPRQETRSCLADQPYYIQIPCILQIVQISWVWVRMYRKATQLTRCFFSATFSCTKKSLPMMSSHLKPLVHWVSLASCRESCFIGKLKDTPRTTLSSQMSAVSMKLEVHLAIYSSSCENIAVMKNSKTF